MSTNVFFRYLDLPEHVARPDASNWSPTGFFPSEEHSSPLTPHACHCCRSAGSHVVNVPRMTGPLCSGPRDAKSSRIQSWQAPWTGPPQVV